MRKVILSGMHPFGQIINYDDYREYQGRGTQHFHATIHVENAQKMKMMI